MNFEGTYIWFVHIPDNSKKTQVWQIQSKQKEFLGMVKWFSRWRKYCFFPAHDCVFEETCLKEIRQFLIDRMQERRR
jgi:hypothetical protein